MMKFKSIWIGRENPNQIWTKNLSFPPLCPVPKPNPGHLSFSEGNFGSSISSNSLLLPHTKLIYQQLHLNLILQPGYSQPQFGPISRHGPWSCWLTLGKSCATWDWNHWVWSLEWGPCLGSGRTWLGLCYAIGFWKFCFPLMVLWGREKG